MDRLMHLVLFKKVFVGNNCVIKNSIILNDVYLGDNTHIENCIIESRVIQYGLIHIIAEKMVLKSLWRRTKDT